MTMNACYGLKLYGDQLLKDDIFFINNLKDKFLKMKITNQLYIYLTLDIL